MLNVFSLTHILLLLTYCKYFHKSACDFPSFNDAGLRTHRHAGRINQPNPTEVHPFSLIHPKTELHLIRGSITQPTVSPLVVHTASLSFLLQKQRLMFDLHSKYGPSDDSTYGPSDGSLSVSGLLMMLD